MNQNKQVDSNNSFDKVTAPSHYYKNGVWCEDMIKAITSNLTGFESVCVANIVKYLWRYKEKNGIEDVKKARKYNDMLLGYLEEDAAAARNTSSVSKTGHFKMVDF